MSSFKILSKDETAVNSVKIDGDVVRMQHATTHPKIAAASTGQRIQFSWSFDFADVSRAELLELASRSLVITCRTPFKNLDAPEPDDWNDFRLAVREWIDDQKRKPVNKVDRAKKALEALSDEEKQAILDALLSS